MFLSLVYINHKGNLCQIFTQLIDLTFVLFRDAEINVHSLNLEETNFNQKVQATLRQLFNSANVSEGNTCANSKCLFTISCTVTAQQIARNYFILHVFNRSSIGISILFTSVG